MYVREECPRKDVKQYLSIWVICRLETDFLDTHFAEEYSHETWRYVVKPFDLEENTSPAPIKSASVSPRSATTPST